MCSTSGDPRRISLDVQPLALGGGSPEAAPTRLAIASIVNHVPTPFAAWPPTLSDAPALTPLLVVGGSFDPPHLAHVDLPRRVRDTAAPDALLLFVPAATSPFKQHQAGTAAEHRVAMLRLAIQDLPRAGVWTDEVDRSSGATPSYTIDTLNRVRSLRPVAPLMLLIGADQAVVFHRWREARDILALARVLVVRRAPYETKAALLDEMGRAAFWSVEELSRWRESVVDVPLDAVSATRIRAEIHEHGVGSVAGVLAPSVRAYIEKHRLYV